MENPSYYSIIPADVRYDKGLKDKAKLLYGEITSLSNKDGYCYASNKYFAELYGVTTTTISLLIKNLVEKGYLESEIIYKENSKEIEGRYLRIIKGGYLKNLKEGYLKNLKEGYLKNFKDNNINNINNININKKINKKENISTAKQIIDYLNLKTNKHFRYTDNNLKKILKKLEEFEPEDFKIVIDKKTKEWLDDNKMNCYLRPETLFGSKFESYLNQREKILTTKDVHLSEKEIEEFFGG